MQKRYVRLPLRNAYNVRDLGGYACSDGKTTKWNNLIRGDDLTNLNEDETDFLINYGVKTVIDLRSENECSTNPDPFAQRSDVQYMNIPLMDNVMADPPPEMIRNFDFSLSKTYADLADNAQPKIKKVIEAIIDSNGGVLFHCAAGKDRTGVIAMLLLGAAGVSEADIISNYEVTFTYLKQNSDLVSQTRKYPSDVMMSKPEYIEKLIDHVSEKYGTVKQYLYSAGLSERAVLSLQDILSE